MSEDRICGTKINFSSPVKKMRLNDVASNQPGIVYLNKIVCFSHGNAIVVECRR